jgi:hypothetical protein
MMVSQGGKRIRQGKNWLRRVLWLVCWSAIALPIARAQLAEVALTKHMPGQALLIEPQHARALAGSAVALQRTGQQQQAIKLARAALKREPMNVVALRTLGQALEQTGAQASANQIMFLAARLGWRDVALQLWLIKAYALQGNVREALRRADALARTNHLPQITYPIFIASITDDQLRSALVHEMADRPYWRGVFFNRLLELPADRMIYFDRLVDDLAKAGSPITPAERDIYLARLVQVGQGATAYRYWLRDQRAAGVATSIAPWDGGFDHVPPPGSLAAPFEWQISPQSTGVVSIVPSATSGQQLSVSAGHDFSGTLVSQTLALQPGRYEVRARVQGDAASTGLHWTMRCLPDQNELVLGSGREETALGTTTFEVPTRNCTAQVLAIDLTSEGDSAGSGDVMIDDINIRRVG